NILTQKKQVLCDLRVLFGLFSCQTPVHTLLLFITTQAVYDIDKSIFWLYSIDMRWYLFIFEALSTNPHIFMLLRGDTNDACFLLHKMQKISLHEQSGTGRLLRSAHVSCGY
ncbi:hypothetical protein AALC16_15320, partial [Lachnospiraceae bacterium 29-91]